MPDKELSQESYDKDDGRYQQQVVTYEYMKDHDSSGTLPYVNIWLLNMDWNVIYRILRHSTQDRH